MAYEDVNLNRGSNSRNILLFTSGDFIVFGNQKGSFAGYGAGDSIRVEVDMAAKRVTFYKNGARLCQAEGITAPVRPFVTIGWSDVVITISSSTGTALHLAAHCNTGGGVVGRLLDVGGQELLDWKNGDDGQTARELAAAHGHTAVVAEIDSWVAQQAAWEEEGARNASLIAAARNDDVPTIQTLLAKGANLYAQDAQGFSALHAAAQAGHKDVADWLLTQGGVRLASLTTKEGKTARDLTVCQLRGALIAKPELTDTMQGVLAAHQASVNQVSDPSKERVRSSMMALLDSQMARLDTAALQSQTALTASDEHESKYLLTYEQEQAQLRENAAASLEKSRLTRDKHEKLEKELRDQQVQLWHEQMSQARAAQEQQRAMVEQHAAQMRAMVEQHAAQMRAMHEQQRAMHEQHAAKLREVEEQLQTDNEQLNRDISCIYDRHAEEQGRFRAILERVESIQAAYVKAYDPAKHPFTPAEHLILVKGCLLSMDFTPGGSADKFLSDPNALVVGTFSKAAEGWAKLACKDEDELNAKVAEVDLFLKSCLHIYIIYSDFI